MKKRYYYIITNERASMPDWIVTGQRVYPGADFYGIASDDSRATGIDHISMSVNESGEPFFTIPRADVNVEVE